MAGRQTNDKLRVPQLKTLVRPDPNAPGVVNIEDVGLGTGSQIRVDQETGVVTIVGSPDFHLTIQDWNSTTNYKAGDVIVRPPAANPTAGVIWRARRANINQDPNTSPDDWQLLFGAAVADGVISGVSYSKTTQRLTITRSKGSDITLDLSDLETGDEATAAINAAIAALTATLTTDIDNLETKVDRIAISAAGGVITFTRGDGSTTDINIEELVGRKKFIVQQSDTGAVPVATASDVGKVLRVGNNLHIGKIIQGSDGDVTFSSWTPSVEGLTYDGVVEHYGRHDPGLRTDIFVYSKAEHAFYKRTGVILGSPGPIWSRVDPQPATVIGNFVDEQSARDGVISFFGEGDIPTTQWVGTVVEYGNSLHRVTDYSEPVAYIYGWVQQDEIQTLFHRKFTDLPDTPDTLTAGKFLKVNSDGDGLEETDPPMPTHTIPNVNRLPAVTDDSPNLVYLTHDYSTGRRQDATVTVAQGAGGIIGYSNGRGFPAMGSISKRSPLDYIIGTGTLTNFSLSQIGSFNEDFIDDIQHVLINDTSYTLGDKLLNAGVFQRNIIDFPTGLSGTVTLNFDIDESGGLNVFQFTDGGTETFGQGIYTKAEGAYHRLIYRGLTHVDGFGEPQDPPTAAAQSHVANDGRMWVAGDEIFYTTNPPSITSRLFTNSYYNTTAGSFTDLDDGEFVAHFTGGIYQRQGTLGVFVTWTEAWTYIVTNVENTAALRNLRDNSIFLGSYHTEELAAIARNVQTDDSKTYYWRNDSELPELFYEVTDFTPSTDTRVERFFWRGPLVTPEDVYEITTPLLDVTLEDRIAWNAGTRSESSNANVFLSGVFKANRRIKIHSVGVFIGGPTSGVSRPIGAIFGKMIKSGSSFSYGTSTTFGHFYSVIPESLGGGTESLIFITPDTDEQVEERTIVLPREGTPFIVEEGEYFSIGIYSNTAPNFRIESIDSGTVVHNHSVFLEDTNFHDAMEYEGLIRTSSIGTPGTTTHSVTTDDALKMRFDYSVEEREKVVINHDGTARAFVKEVIHFDGNLNVVEEDGEAHITVIPDLIVHKGGELREPTADDFDEQSNTSRVLGWNGNKVKKVVKKLAEEHTGTATFTRVTDGTTIGTMRWRGPHYQDYLVSNPQINDFFWDRHNGRFRFRADQSVDRDQFSKTVNDVLAGANLYGFTTGDVTSVGPATAFSGWNQDKNAATMFWDGTRFRPSFLVFDTTANTVTINFNAETGYDSTIFNGARVSVNNGGNTVTLGTAAEHDTGFTLNGLDLNYRITGTGLAGDSPNTWTLLVTPASSSDLVVLRGHPRWITLPANDTRLTTNNIIATLYNSQADALAHVTANGQRVLYSDSGGGMGMYLVSGFTAPNPDHIIYEWENVGEAVFSGRRPRTKLFDSSEVTGFSLANIDSTFTILPGVTEDVLQQYDTIIFNLFDGTTSQATTSVNSHLIDDLFDSSFDELEQDLALTYGTADGVIRLNASNTGVLRMRILGPGGSFDDSTDKLIIYGV